MKKAVVLLSGGLDSATVLAIAKSQGFDCYCLSLDYHQRHVAELQAADRVSKALNAAMHRTVNLDLSMFGGSALTDNSIAVPQAPTEGIPVTYVPARNTIMLSLALAWAETLAAQDIFIGVNALDYAGYPDCRPEYITAFEQVADLATKAGVEGQQHLKIHTPLIHLSKSEIIRKAVEFGVDFSLTSSCYEPSADRTACGRCDACLLRQQGFEEAGFVDPIRYAGS